MQTANTRHTYSKTNVIKKKLNLKLLQAVFPRRSTDFAMFFFKIYHMASWYTGTCNFSYARSVRRSVLRLSRNSDDLTVMNITCTIFSPNRKKWCKKHVSNFSYALKVWISKHRFSRNSQNAQKQHVQVHTEFNQLDRSVTVTQLIFTNSSLPDKFLY
jgi:hypothetical protein